MQSLLIFIKLHYIFAQRSFEKAKSVFTSISMQKANSCSEETKENRKKKYSDLNSPKTITITYIVKEDDTL